MKRLSQITESIWSDIQDRSAGESVRKENQWILDIIKEFIERHNIKEGDYKINPNFSIDVYCSIQLKEEDMIDNKIPFKFGKVDGDFRISDIPIETLENSPDEVTGTYIITFTKIESLYGSPKVVGHNFNVNFNKKLVTLAGSPEKVGGDYKFFSSWNVNDIKGISPEIGGNVMYSQEHGTPKFSDDEFRKYSNIKGQIIRK